jgi:heat shock protein HslJ
MTTTNANLEGNWILQSGVELPLAPNTEITAEFKDGKLSGYGGCNYYNTTYTVEPLDQHSGKIQLQGGIVSTRKGGANLKQEGEYFNALKQVGEYNLTDEDLTLSYSSPWRYLNFIRQ